MLKSFNEKFNESKKYINNAVLDAESGLKDMKSKIESKFKIARKFKPHTQSNRIVRLTLLSL
jgi:hypothetical protein